MTTIDLWSLEVGDRLHLESGIIAEVITTTEDGQWVKVRYLRVPDSPKLEGTEDLCFVEEVVGLEQSS